MHYKLLGDNTSQGRRKALRFVFFWLRKSIFAPQARSFSVLEKFCICLVSNRSRSSEKRTLQLGGEWISTPWKSLLFASSREIYAIYPKVIFLLCIFNSSFNQDFPSLHWISFLELQSNSRLGIPWIDLPSFQFKACDLHPKLIYIVDIILRFQLGCVRSISQLLCSEWNCTFQFYSMCFHLQKLYIVRPDFHTLQPTLV